MWGMDFLIPIFLFLSTAAVIIISLTIRHRERMTMIEKGVGSEEIKALYIRNIRSNPLTSLKWGILFAFTGLAVLLGNYLHTQYNIQEGSIVGLVCLFVGLGLLLFYSLTSKRLEQ